MDRYLSVQIQAVRIACKVDIKAAKFIRSPNLCGCFTGTNIIIPEGICIFISKTHTCMQRLSSIIFNRYSEIWLTSSNFEIRRSASTAGFYITEAFFQNQITGPGNWREDFFVYTGHPGGRCRGLIFFALNFTLYIASILSIRPFPNTNCSRFRVLNICKSRDTQDQAHHQSQHQKHAKNISLPYFSHPLSLPFKRKFFDRTIYLLSWYIYY